MWLPARPSDNPKIYFRLFSFFIVSSAISFCCFVISSSGCINLENASAAGADIDAVFWYVHNFHPIFRLGKKHLLSIGMVVILKHRDGEMAGLVILDNYWKNNFKLF